MAGEQHEDKQRQGKSVPCQTIEHRAFDFWLGTWKVTSPDRPSWQAKSEITLGNDGCSLHESYRTPSGYKGSSVNFYDASKKEWVQTWIDNQGGPLYLNGQIQDGAMVMSDGLNQITWTPLEDGRVRQHWVLLDAKGEVLKTAFDGYYQLLESTALK